MQKLLSSIYIHFVYYVFLGVTLFYSKVAYSNSPFSIGLKKNQKSLYVETNYLLYMLGIAYDYTTIIDKKHGWSFSAGISTIDSKSKYIIPPNIGIPLNAAYLLGKRTNFLELGISLRPQFFFTKDYVHHDHFTFRTVLEENTSLVYLTPRIGYRYHSKNYCLKIGVGPQFKIMESDYVKYTGEVFEDYKHLESFYLQFSIGFNLN